MTWDWDFFLAGSVAAAITFHIGYWLAKRRYRRPEDDWVLSIDREPDDPCSFSQAGLP